MERLEDIRSVLSMAAKAGMSEIELIQPGIRFAATFDPYAEVLDEDVTEALASNEPAAHTITSQFVGYFQPQDPAIQVGSTVKAGDVLGRISGLGLSNDIEADQDGEIVAVLAQREDALEYGQPVFQMKVNP